MVATANEIKSDDDDAYYDAWYNRAARHRIAVEEAERRGGRADGLMATASGCVFLRTCSPRTVGPGGLGAPPGGGLGVASMPVRMTLDLALSPEDLEAVTTKLGVRNER
jgi:hypothetical protein